MDVYLIPGLGADHRLFAKLELPGHALHPLDWPEMPVGSTLADFARALAQRIDIHRPHALVGVSMGGMVAQELAAITKPEKVIIISSWKGPQEMPKPLRMLRGTHPERVMSAAVIERTKPFLHWQMSVSSKEDIALFDALLKVHGPAQLRVQIDAALNWIGPPEPVKDLVHIHGDSDHLMPITPIKGAQVVVGGGHFMVYTLGEQVAALVQQALTA
jgi:pimeloyl-ACP methyl ester carboxylesterase